MTGVIVSPGHLPVEIPDYDPDSFTLLKPDAFLKQKVFFYNGIFATREDVIKYVANKMGGSHFDKNRDNVNASLDAIRTMVGLHLLVDGTLCVSMDIKHPPDLNLLDTLTTETNKIDPILFELLATCRFLYESESVQQLCNIIRQDSTLVLKSKFKE
jgi:hypothetical protein